MTDILPSDFADCWLAYQREKPAGSALWLRSEWVIGAELDWGQKRAADLFEAIRIVCRNNLSDWEIELLGAGPLETLLNANYKKVVSKVFEEAARSDILAGALNYVNPPEAYEVDFYQQLSKIYKR